MAKGIIVVDMPERCDDCPLEAYNETFYGDELNHWCPFEYKGYTDDVRGNRRADWCPIKPCYSSDDQNISLIDGESVVLSPKELIGLLKKAPQDDILMVEINDGKDESGVVDDVMIGGGTGKGFTYIKVSTDI